MPAAVTGSAYSRVLLSRFCRIVAALLAIFVCVSFPLPVRSHDGHDHGGDKAALEIASRNRASAVSDIFQLVVVLDRDTLILSLDRQETLAPVMRADVTVTIGASERKAEPRPDGTFSVHAPEATRPGRHELIVSVRDGDTTDLLITALDVTDADKSSGRPRVVADVPSRLSDGSVFLPKATQRLIGLRTAAATTTEIEPAISLVGRIIADPNRSGVVQSTIVGRIGLVDASLPKLGQPVKAGQVLALVTPTLAAIDISNVQQAGAELDQQIALAQNKVEQFRPLVRNNTLSPERLRTVEIELDNLRRRRASLALNQRGAEPLTAPIDGVIAGMRAIPGQVVTPSDVLFQIVDPSGLWVEALVFDPSVPEIMDNATAQAHGLSALKLTYVGRSRAMQQLSTIMHFSIATPPPTLNIGTPVTVLARAREQVRGLLIPRASLVSAPSGESIVWVQSEPERFHPRPVKSRHIDGETILIEAGLKEGDRVVTITAELLNQVR